MEYKPSKCTCTYQQEYALDISLGDFEIKVTVKSTINFEEVSRDGSTKMYGRQE